MDLTHQPAQIGVCPHCDFPLYEDAPTRITHVACAVYAQRDLKQLRAAAVEALILDGGWNPAPAGACGVRAMTRRRRAEELVDLVLNR